MKLKPQSRPWAGLNVIEVMLVLGTVGLLGLVVLPMLARPKPGRNRLGCTSNLKQVGLAYRMFSNDHDDKFPFAVADKDGGTLSFVNSSNVFRHFEALSNEVVTPKVLVCPVERLSGARVPATDFLTGIANSNVSYFVGLDADESKPGRLLSGDRNIAGGKLSEGWLRLLTPVSPADWTGEVHRNGKVFYGNIGLADGNVLQMEAPRLRQQLQTNRLAVTRLAIP